MTVLPIPWFLEHHLTNNTPDYSTTKHFPKALARLYIINAQSRASSAITLTRLERASHQSEERVNRRNFPAEEKKKKSHTAISPGTFLCYWVNPGAFLPRDLAAPSAAFTARTNPSCDACAHAMRVIAPARVASVEPFFFLCYFDAHSTRESVLRCITCWTSEVKLANGGFGNLLTGSRS